MTDAALWTIFNNYLGAFAETSSVERQRLLGLSVAEDVVFTNPGVDGRGLDDLLAHIAKFQLRFPGGRFRVNWFVQQHGQLLSEWTQVDGDGSELMVGYSYARLNDQGRLSYFAGFWKPSPEI